MSWKKEDIQNIVEKSGYTLIDEYSDRNYKKIIIVDKNGYLYDVDFYQFRKNNVRPIPFSPDNPYVLNNISTWLKINNKTFTICENNIYNGNLSDLNFYCTCCGYEFSSNWVSIKNGLKCPICNSLAIKNRKMASEIYENNKIIKNIFD